MISSSLRRNRLFAGLFAAVLATTGIAAGAAPASATPASAPSISFRTIDYVALGDSYAAGQGAVGPGDFVCERTRLAYPKLLDLVPRVKLVKNAACTNATTATVRDTQLGKLGRGTDLVTLTVGVNDLEVNGLGLVHLLGACTTDRDSDVCTGGVAALQGELAKVQAGETEHAFSRVGALVAGLLQVIRSKAPNAKILVTGYPRPFEPDPEQPLFELVNTGTDVLNMAIAGAVQASGVGKAKFVDVTKLFLRHGVNSRVPWLIRTGPDAFHPNALGQAAYALAVGRAAF